MDQGRWRRMIASLCGTLAELRPLNDVSVEAVVEVGGVGYRVLLTTRLAAVLGPLGGEVSVSVHTHVREGDITLYGFADRSERMTFEAVLGAHGIGPALALAILGALSPPELSTAIAAGDLDTLSRVPGVGRKTAQRLVLDLAQRLEGFGAPTGPSGGTVGADPARAEAREALLALGYGADEIRDTLEQIAQSDSVEELLRGALRELAPRR